MANLERKKKKKKNKTKKKKKKKKKKNKKTKKEKTTKSFLLPRKHFSLHKAAPALQGGGGKPTSGDAGAKN